MESIAVDSFSPPAAAEAPFTNWVVEFDEVDDFNPERFLVDIEGLCAALVSSSALTPLPFSDV